MNVDELKSLANDLTISKTFKPGVKKAKAQEWTWTQLQYSKFSTVPSTLTSFALEKASDNVPF